MRCLPRSLASTVRSVFCLYMVFLCLPILHAQFRTSIQGTVADPSGAVLPDVKFTLADKQTNQTLVTFSDQNGVYNFNALGTDQFKLRAEKQGFKAQIIENVPLIPEQANAINIVLQVGQISTSVTVLGNSIPSLETESAAIDGTITSTQIQYMPTVGRDVTQLAQLAPGVFGDGGQGSGGSPDSLPGPNTMAAGTNSQGIFKTENSPQVSANGGQTNMNGVLIDGISVASVSWGGSTVITPSQESVESVKVTSNSYDAELGRFSSGVIQITSKSGSNQFHGSAFLKGERPGLNAYQRWNGPNSVREGTPGARGLNRDTSRFNQFGGSLGAPIWKDKLFGFFAYEGQRMNTVNTAQGWYDTSALFALAPVGSNAAKYMNYPGEKAAVSTVIGGTCADIGMTDGAQCATIAGQGVDVGSPLKTPLGTSDPTYGNSSNTPGVGSGLDGSPDFAYVNLSSPFSFAGDQYFGRMDAQVTPKDRISSMVYWVPQSESFYNGPMRSANLWHHTQTNDAFTALWNHTFSPTLLNEVRVNAAGWRWNEVTSNPQEPFGLVQASFGVNGSVFPNMNPQFFGAPGPSIFDQWTYGYQDVLTKIAGKHALKAGASLTRLYFLNEGPWWARPSFSFANLWDFMNDAPYSESGSFDPKTGKGAYTRQDDRVNLGGAFVQDDWKVAPTLTLNLGIRYAYFGPYYDKGNGLSVVTLGAGSAMMTGIKATAGSSNLYNAQKGNFGPQVGFAWNPQSFEHRLVVRGGGGINYNQNEIQVTSQGTGNAPYVLGSTFCCNTPTTANPGIQYNLAADAHSLGGSPADTAAISSIGANGLPTSATATVSLTAFDPNVKTIMTYHYSLGAQYDLGHNWVATAGYQGSVSHHLIVQQNMMAIAAIDGYAFNPNVTGVNYYGNKANSSYNALLTSIKHNFSHSFQLEGQYALAKSMDNGSTPFYQDPYPYDLKYSHGRSDFNVQDMFKLFGMWRPNFFHSALLHNVADGWTLSGIFNAHTGFPWNPTYNVSGGSLYYQNSGYGTVLPAAYLGGAKHSTSNAAFEAAPGTAGSNYQNGNSGTAYFTAPTYTAVSGSAPANTIAPPPQAPGVARNSFDGPGYKSTDASLTKGFRVPNMRVLGEGGILEIRADAFNFFNNVNLTNPSTNAQSTTFGQSQSALGARVVDIQARFSF